MNVIHWRACTPSKTRYILQFVQVNNKIEIWYLIGEPIFAPHGDNITAVWKIKPRIND